MPLGPPRALGQTAGLRLAMPDHGLAQTVAATEHLLGGRRGEVLRDGRVDIVGVLVLEAVRVVQTLVELAVADVRVAVGARVVAEGGAPLRRRRAVDRVAVATAHGQAVVGQVSVARVVVAVPVGVLVVG